MSPELVICFWDPPIFTKITKNALSSGANDILLEIPQNVIFQEFLVMYSYNLHTCIAEHKHVLHNK